jgi:hypothetical protein
MTQIDTRGGRGPGGGRGGEAKVVQKFNTYFFNGPFHATKKLSSIYITEKLKRKF